MFTISVVMNIVLSLLALELARRLAASKNAQKEFKESVMDAFSEDPKLRVPALKLLKKRYSVSIAGSIEHARALLSRRSEESWDLFLAAVRLNVYALRLHRHADKLAAMGLSMNAGSGGASWWPDRNKPVDENMAVRTVRPMGFISFVNDRCDAIDRYGNEWEAQCSG